MCDNCKPTPRRVWLPAGPYLSVATPEQKVVIEAQMKETITSALVTCPCGFQLPLRGAYRCLYCGIYFCAHCAEIHFGQTIHAYEQECKAREAASAGVEEDLAAEIVAPIILEHLIKFLNRFPVDATEWSQATDELPDMYNWLRKKGAPMVDVKLIDTPEGWNTTYRAAIYNHFNRMSPREKVEFSKHWETYLYPKEVMPVGKNSALDNM